jgi:selenocysteine lyase/cysteine desulfurase
MATTPFGRQMRDEHFAFAPAYTPLNHGSYGAFPLAVRSRQRAIQEQTESRSDRFIRFTARSLLLESRSAVASLLNVPRQTVVFVPNATTGINTVLRNLPWNEGDVIVYLSTAYGACEKTILHVCETTPASSVRIDVSFPAEDDELIRLFKDTVQGINSQRDRRVKIALFDTVCTFPGVRLPWEALVAACKQLGVLSLVDGAHGIGHLDLSRLGQSESDPDFFTTNCYKWLFTPRGCAVLYVPTRHHHLIRTTFPTSHGFKPLGDTYGEISTRIDANDYLGDLFAWAATVDMSPYLCVPEAIKFRSQICGGETAIRDYCFGLAQEGGKRMASIFGTEVLDNRTCTLSQCCFAMVRLPLVFAPDPSSGPYTITSLERKVPVFPSERGPELAKTIMDTLMTKHDTWIPAMFYRGAIWARVSAQIYLEMADFEWAAEVLVALCNDLRDTHAG